MDSQVGRGTLGDFVKEAQKGRAREDSTSKSSKIASVVHDAAEEDVRVVLAAGIVATRRVGIQHDMMVKQKEKHVVVFIVLAFAIDQSGVRGRGKFHGLWMRSPDDI